MNRIDASEQGLFQLSWSPDSEWLAYVRNEDEVCINNISTGEIRVLGDGSWPSMTADNSVVMERDQEIVLNSGSGQRVLVSRGDLVRNTPKRQPLLSPDGKTILFVVNNVFDKDSQNKNAYPYRHFVGIADVSKGKPIITDQQWYGGTATWFDDGDKFTHFEFDSTGGARVHVVDKRGQELGTMFGLYPSISPDGTRIACKPKSGGNVVIYSGKGGWDKDSVETSVIRIPDSSGRLSGSPPQWLDNRLLLTEDSGKLWRVDTRKEEATHMKKMPIPVARGSSTMILSPSRELLAAEVASEAGYELVVAPVA